MDLLNSGCFSRWCNPKLLEFLFKILENCLYTWVWCPGSKTLGCVRTCSLSHMDKMIIVLAVLANISPTNMG